MALKFLNKKGWHTGSLRNIENVWKAEQKHDAEQKKLEELRKQIQEERERSEFRLLQEQAGLVPKQERLDFLYDSGLAVGKGSSSGFKALESLPKPDPDPDLPSSSSTKQQQPSVPGALFEEKPQSANDAWRKLHSDPLLLIRQREQEALAHVKNNPVQMAMIRKSVEAKKQKEKFLDGEERSKKRHHQKSKHQKHSSSRHHFDPASIPTRGDGEKHTKKSYGEQLHKAEKDARRKIISERDLNYKDTTPSAVPERSTEKEFTSNPKEYSRKGRREFESSTKEKEDEKFYSTNHRNTPGMASLHESRHKRRNNAIQLSEEERDARLREMQMDAELHEEQRWKRIRKAEEEDAREAIHASMSKGKNFLDAAKKNVYGAGKGGSSTIEESVRRRTHYSQGGSQVGEGNAFRR
ncbi:hypothetical protein RJ640_012580 [Escallonia rubra]|uniref:CBF1-interacting co-repressor CIR N-terminal domain-containing protein n=1 Tax=Escallonia rubra TaxID=112253 RepID=A0AA88UHD0_9ASTE|nr:hypothetical protein RJ640_012580 [Escallonia rubra]